MLEYWWVLLAAAWFAIGVGALLWLYTAIDLTRVVTPSRQWLAQESRHNTWGTRLMVFGAILAVVSVAMAIARWFGI
jgi:hypothetical protein